MSTQYATSSHSLLPLLDKMTVNGYISHRRGTAAASVDIPFLRQGNNKIIDNTQFDIRLDTTSHNGRIYLTADHLRGEAVAISTATVRAQGVAEAVKRSGTDFAAAQFWHAGRGMAIVFLKIWKKLGNSIGKRKVSACACRNGAGGRSAACGGICGRCDA